MGWIEILTLFLVLCTLVLTVKKSRWSFPLWGVVVFLGFCIYSWHSSYLKGVHAPELYSPLELSRRYDQYCYLTTHNAYANHEDGWYYAQQSYSIGQQLHYGVRALMLDIWTYAPQSQPEDIYLCHLACESWTNRLTNGLKRVPQRLEVGLIDIKNFLETHPTEIITIIFESNIEEGSETLIHKAFENSQLLPLLFYADRIHQGENLTWDVGQQGWPTLQWMVSNQKRLVVFSDHKSGVEDGLPFLWDFVIESVYGDASLDSDIVTNRKESSPLSTTPERLFLLN